MLIGESDKKYILKAELHRNIGEFDKCRNSLESIKQIDTETSLFISAISAACDAGNTLTVCVYDHDNPIQIYLPEKIIDNPKFRII